MLPAAQRASQASGVPAQLIMAQAALESGWGKREIRAEDGSNSYNLFGIKADKSWKGPVVETTTTEYVNGVAQKTQARFSAYGSYEEVVFRLCPLPDQQSALRQCAGDTETRPKPRMACNAPATPPIPNTVESWSAS